MSASWARSAALCLVAAAAGPARGAPGAYTVVVTESPDTTYRLAVLPVSNPAGADVVALAINDLFLEPVCLTLGEPGRYALTFEEDGGTGPAMRGYLTKEGGARTLAWVRITNKEVGRHHVFINPLHALGRTARHGLRGVYVEAWSDEVAADLARLDLSRVCVTVELTSKSMRLTRIPAAARFLAIDPGYKIDLAGLSRLHKLVFLSVNTYEDPFDAGGIAGMAELQQLRVAAGEIRNADRMAALRSVRGLVLRAKTGIVSIDFAAAMTRLETVSIAGAVDLGPLAGLAGLVELDAGASQVQRLPEARLPALRKANLMSTRLPDVDVDRFRRWNPQALVLHRWTPLLRDRLRGATEVTLTTLPARREQESRSTVVRDRADVAELVAALEIEDPPAFVLGCMSTHRLTFAGVDGEEKIELANGRDVRWSGFPGDAPLTESALRKVRVWLRRHGVDWTDCR